MANAEHVERILDFDDRGRLWLIRPSNADRIGWRGHHAERTARYSACLEPKSPMID